MAWQQQKREYAGEFPTEVDAEGKPFYGPRAEIHRAAEQTWERSIRRALSLGLLDQKEARAHGYYSHDWGESDERPGEGWQSLPPVLYHVTTAKSAVLRERLKSRVELGQEQGLGLGGGAEDTISFTTDPKVAKAVEVGLREMRLVARGELTVPDMLTMAEQGEGATRPYIEGVYGYWERDRKTGDPVPEILQRLQAGEKAVQAPMGGWHSEDLMRAELGPVARPGRIAEIGDETRVELSAEQRPRWTLVDAAWTPTQGDSVSRDNGSSG